MKRRLRDGRDGRALVEELERIGDALPAGPPQSHWFLELGVACEMLVPERQRALQLYGRAAECDAGNVEATERGRMVSRELGRVDQLIRLTELELGRETDEERRERLSALIGEALLDRGDRQRALAFLVRAAGQYPASLAIQDALGTVGYDDDWRSELERLITIGADAEDAQAGARVSLRAARILGMEAPSDPRYEQLLQRVLFYDPYDESAHQLLERFYAGCERWDALDELQTALMSAFPGADEQAALCQRFSFGWIARGQPDRAAAWCWRAIELGRLVYPIAGLTMLRAIYGARRDWDRLLAAVDAILATPLDEDADVHTALLGGTIAWKAKADLARAGSYFDRVRRVASDSLMLVDFDDALTDLRQPETLDEPQRALVEAARAAGKSGGPPDRAIEAWKRAIAADATKRGPRRQLARVLYRAERWRTLADALKDEEAHASRDDRERVALLFQLAALYRDRLQQHVLATATLQRLLELEPGNLAALDQLETAFTGVRRWPDVVATLQRKLAHVVDVEERVSLQLRLADIWQEQLGNEAESVKALEAALALDPGRAELSERLERIYGRRRDWDKLFLLKQKKMLTIDAPEARLAWQLELALLATEKLKKPALAIEAWQGVLALDATHDAALTALERLYALVEAHGPLADLYARRAEQPNEAQLGYLAKLGALCMEQLGDAPRAIATFRRLLALAPGQGRTLELLKRLYASQRAWDELEALFADEQRLDECARWFERQAGDELPAVQVELWLRAARLWQSLGRRDAALRAFERVLALAPGHDRAVDALVALYEEANDPRKLAGALALQLGRNDGHGADETARLARLAKLHARELHDPTGAFAWQLRAFARAPDDGELRAELERLATPAAGWAELVARYREAAAGEALTDDVRVALRATVARAEETALGDVDATIASWSALLARKPPLPEAVTALVRLYEARAAWRELHDVYARQLAFAHDVMTRRPVVIAMAALAEKQGDDARAIAAYRRLVDELGADDGTLDALERLHERQGDLGAVEAVLRERAALPTLAGDAARATALTFRLAEVRRRRGHPSDALALLGRVLEAEPGHAGARAALDAIVDGPAPALEAARLLEPLVRAGGNTARLGDVLRIRVAHAATPADAVALLHELAWIEEHELHARDRAFAALAQALETDPAHAPTYDALEGLESDGLRLAALYQQLAARPLDVDGHVAVRCRLGALYRDRLGEPERALRTFSRVLDLARDHGPANRAVDELLAAGGQHGELAQRMRAQLERAPDAAEAPARRLRLAQLLEGPLGDGAAAVDAYAALLAGDAADADAMAGLERLFAAGVERRRVAELLMPRYRDAGRAADLVRVWAAALAEAPDNHPLDELLALAHTAGVTSALTAPLTTALTRATRATTRTALRRVLATLAEARGDQDAAEALWRALVTEAPDDDAAWRALDQLLDGAGRQRERRDVLVERARLAGGADERRALLLTRATLESDVLAEPDRARATLEEALTLGDEATVLRALGRLGDDATAIDRWQRLRALVPDDAEALATLAALYERDERWAELGDVLERQLATVPADAAPSLVEQLALLWTRLDDDARAEAAWRRLATLRPDAPEPLRALARRLRAASRWAELADVLEALVAREPDAASVAVELARLETETLERPERAIAAWQRLLAVAPLQEAKDEALAALDHLYARTGRDDERRRALDERARAALDARRDGAAQLALDAAHAAAAAGDAAAAASWYGRILAVEPTHATAQAQLEAHHHERRDWRALVELLRAYAAAQPTPDARGERLGAVAAIEERELGDANAAFATRLDAFEGDGRWELHGDELKRLAGADANGWSLLAAALQRRAAKAPAERVALYLELGAVLETARQPGAAVEAYRAALTVDAGAVAALERLEQLYRDSGAPALLDVLERRAQLAADRHEPRDEQLALWETLATAAARLERWARAVDAHQHAAALARPGEARGQQLLGAGLICRDQLADFDEARTLFEAAAANFADDGADPPAALTEALARRSGGGARAARTTPDI